MGSNKVGTGPSLSVSSTVTTVYICRAKSAGNCVVESSITVSVGSVTTIKGFNIVANAYQLS